jgi:MOSC domain-containing protein YiiM
MKLSDGVVVSVGRDSRHRFSKPAQASITLLAGLGVEGDAHAGASVKHRSRWAKTPAAANLRQVHLIHSELHEELAGKGFSVAPGDMGENITTAGLALLDLPRGAVLRIGSSAVVEVTGLRNPCIQLDRFQQGLSAAVLERAADGRLVRKAGVMGIVLATGEVRPGDAIAVDLPPSPHAALECV